MENSPKLKWLELENSFEFEVVRVDKQGKIIDTARKKAEYFSEDLGNGVTLDLVAIPGGVFIMGVPEDEKDTPESERPQHQVTIEPFLMGQFPVTQAQWKAIAKLPLVERALEAEPSSLKGEKRPVECVCWDDAVEFCQRLSKQTGLLYRLPSEAEWEYACRAQTSTPFYFGQTITSELANYRGSETYGCEAKGEDREQTTEVGIFPPNAFGLYDMHGLVWEWCADHWHSNYEGAPSDGGGWFCENENYSRVVRGGSWRSQPDYCRSGERNLNVRDVTDINIGFRVVCGQPSTGKCESCQLGK